MNWTGRNVILEKLDQFSMKRFEEGVEVFYKCPKDVFAWKNQSMGAAAKNKKNSSRRHLDQGVYSM